MLSENRSGSMNKGYHDADIFPGISLVARVISVLVSCDLRDLCNPL